MHSSASGNVSNPTESSVQTGCSAPYCIVYPSANSTQERGEAPHRPSRNWTKGTGSILEPLPTARDLFSQPPRPGRRPFLSRRFGLTNQFLPIRPPSTAQTRRASLSMWPTHGCPDQIGHLQPDITTRANQLWTPPAIRVNTRTCPHGPDHEFGSRYNCLTS
jgi:hypothetical protein